MVTQIWTLQVCIVIFRFIINIKFSVKFINQQYKVFRFTIISIIYIFHLTVVMINSDRLVKLVLIRIWFVNINKCIRKKKKLKVCVVYFIIFKIRKYVIYYIYYIYTIYTIYNYIIILYIFYLPSIEIHGIFSSKCRGVLKMH